jgi:predicted MFS family arabinose efflux permease
MPRQVTERLFTRTFVALAVADLAYSTAVNGLAVFALPLYVTGPLGGDEAWAGVTIGAFAVSALLLRPVAGRLTDQVGRRPLLLGGALLAAACLALLTLADTLVAIVALRLVAGVAEAAFFVAGFAALADIAPPERMGEALSYNSLGLYLGIALGPPLAEALIGVGGFATAWFAGAGLAALAAAVVVLVGETATPSAGAEAVAHFIHRPALPVSLAFLTSVVAIGGFSAFASLHAGRVGMANASLALFVYGGTVVVCRIAFARVPDRLPPLALGAASLGVMAVGLGTMAVWQTPVGLLLGAGVLALGVTFSTPAFFSAVFATAAPAERGAASGTASAALDLGLGVGPVLLGTVAAAQGIPWAFAAGAAVAAAGAGWTLLLLRGRARPEGS